MRNKLMMGAASAALLLAVATPAFANGWSRPSYSTDTAFVNNGSTATANSGGGVQINKASGGFVMGGAVGTNGTNVSTSGAAVADSTAVVVANTKVGCSACGGGITTSTAFVNNGSTAGANSGNGVQVNKASAGMVGFGGQVGTTGLNSSASGPAVATSNAWSVVNTRISLW
jgi:hypothetical protein